MIIELDNHNMHYLDNTFLSTEIVEKEKKNNPYAKFLVLIENEEVIGYIYYSDIYERAEINQFEIKKEKRNLGNGDLLLKKMLEIVDKDITLEVRENNIPAIKVYEKNGFEKKAIRKGYYRGIDGILMERKRKQ